MLGRDITYTDFDGEEVTEKFWFNLTATELIEWEASVDGGLRKFIQNIINTQDNRQIIEQFKSFILKAYGVRDGKRFVKNDQLREEFTQTAAYDALFMELGTKANAAADFIIACVPPEIRGQMSSDKPILPPPPPTTPKVA